MKVSEIDNVLTINDIYKEYNQIPAVNGISLTVRKGDIFGFLGNNGAGKTTTIRIILGLLTPSRGTVSINGYCIKKERIKALSCVGALVEGPAFYSYLSGYDNLEIFASYYPNKISPSRIKELLELVGLENHARKKTGSYSLGMKQRLGIAQALLNQPDILILDEPTNGLDPHGVKELRDLIHTLNREYHVTFFISSHILSEVQQVCNKVAIIDRGKIIAMDKVENILNSNNSIYDIVGAPSGELLQALRTIGGVEIISEEPCRIKLLQSKPEEILTKLVSNRIKVMSFSPYRPNLEDFFYSVTYDAPNEMEQ
jgi:ABC-2 type transport system ATP-binding protein